ncbi:MAG: hypothetical protein ACRDZ4_16955 [Egibacteraceae bacterium]
MSLPSSKRRYPTLLAVLFAALTATSCGTVGDTKASDAGRTRATTAAPQSSSPASDPKANATVTAPGGHFEPVFNPANFVETIDNPYLPFAPGRSWVYESKDGGETERSEVVVTNDRKQIMGVSAVVVRDTVTVGGKVTEDTYDWYAQDREGNVWYLGEDTKEYENGKVMSTSGTWEAGIDGAQPGIVMPARPTVGHTYRQERFAGQAEDMAQVVRLGDTATVPYGKLDSLLVTKDWNPLQPKVIEEKYYARGIGLVQEIKVAGGEGRLGLVRATTR